MQTYLDLVHTILTQGELKPDRTGTGTLSIFGYQSRYDLREGFPLLTTKKVLFDAVVRELLWFLKGSTNINDDLAEHTPIWNAWANDDGELGPIYGYQWRRWPRFEANDNGVITKVYTDQIEQVISSIKTDPHSRRHLVSAWNVGDLPEMALPPCHAFFQFYVTKDGHLDCQLYQRSADVALGVPFNIASYALLLTMVAQECTLTPRYLIHTLGDAHIYSTHLEGMQTQLKRTPQSRPTIAVAKKPFFNITFSDITLSNYTPAPFIRFPLAV